MKYDRYLIELCRAFLRGEQIALDNSVDYDGLYRFSSVHNLSAVLFCVINTALNKDTVPESAFKRFENDFLEAVVRSDFQSELIAEIDVLCKKDDIRHIFFKGATVRALFPVPEARAMGDIDVLIDCADRDRFKALLIENGFDCEASNGNVYEYRKGGLLLEAHTRIISDKIGEHDLESAFADAINHAEFDGARGTLDDNYHFAYLIAHIAHHFWFYGAGVKMILDLAVMQKNRQIDTDAVLDILKGCALDGFAKVILTVTHKWFDTGQAFDVSTEKAEDFLLSHGAFGNANRSKAAVITRKDMENGGGSAFGTRIRLLFPPYSRLKNIPYISFIDGRPYLLPAAWAYRIYYNLRHRRSFVKNATHDIGRDEIKKEAAAELAFFEEINLL